MSRIISNIFENAVIHSNTIDSGYLDKKELSEGEIKLSFPSGTFEMRQWNFEGIGIKYFDIQSSSPFSVPHEHEYDVVHLHFNLSGKTGIENRMYGQSFHFSNMHHNINYSRGFKGFTHYLDGNNKTLFVQFTRQQFLTLIENSTEVLMKFGERVLEGKVASVSLQNGLINTQLHQILHSVLNCPYESGLRKLFFLSRCFELLVVQADYFVRQEEKHHFIKSDYDRERILFVREYLLNHISDPPSIPELAKIAGLNEFKLKKGFREIFSTTIFGFLTDYKLEKAKADLRSGKKTASDIASELGYSSLQHFSAAYKKKFGSSPRKTLSEQPF